MKRSRPGPAEGTMYNEDETKAMGAKGYITPRAAAELTGVRVDRVYRAIKAKRVRIAVGGGGEEVHRYYVHKDDWKRFVSALRAKLKAELGM